MTTMTLSDLQLAVRQRADVVNSAFVTDAELTSYINQSYFELYDLLVQKYGDNYFVSDPFDFVTDGTSDSYALPTTFYKLLGVDISISGNEFVTLKPFNFADRNQMNRPNFQRIYGGTNLRYRLHGDKLMISPRASGGQAVRVWFIPRLVPLAQASDTVDGVSGWTEYIICDAAMKVLQKEESDVSVLMAEKMALIARIQAAAENRDAGMPATITDTQSMGFGWHYEGGY